MGYHPRTLDANTLLEAGRPFSGQMCLFSMAVGFMLSTLPIVLPGGGKQSVYKIGGYRAPVGLRILDIENIHPLPDRANPAYTNLCIRKSQQESHVQAADDEA